ncbi:unnamed protein product [Ectocarpus sp. CCAP 1310/34]|nr:unnamed protein product [Ectocarpus sp. CCAP 1310/34]
MKDFVATTIELAKRATSLGARGKCMALLCRRKDGKHVQDFKVKLRRTWDAIQGVTLLAFYDVFRATLLPGTGDMVRVPKNAPQLPPAIVERRHLIEATVQDLVVMGRATNAAHVLRGMPGGGQDRRSQCSGALRGRSPEFQGRDVLGASGAGWHGQLTVPGGTR